METLVGALLCATGPFGHMVLGDSCHGVGVRSCAGGLLKLACALVLSPVGPGPLLDLETSYNFQRWMSWLVHRGRAQRSAISIVNCRIP